MKDITKTLEQSLKLYRSYLTRLRSDFITKKNNRVVKNGINSVVYQKILRDCEGWYNQVLGFGRFERFPS